MPLSLNDLGIRVVDRTWPNVDTSEEAVARVITEALNAGELTLADVLAELLDPRHDRGKRYEALMISLDGSETMTFPLGDLARGCAPNNYRLIRIMAQHAVGLAAIIEIGSRERPVIIERRLFGSWSWPRWLRRRRRRPNV